MWPWSRSSCLSASPKTRTERGKEDEKRSGADLQPGDGSGLGLAHEAHGDTAVVAPQEQKRQERKRQRELESQRECGERDGQLGAALCEGGHDSAVDITIWLATPMGNLTRPSSKTRRRPSARPVLRERRSARRHESSLASRLWLVMFSMRSVSSRPHVP